MEHIRTIKNSGMLVVTASSDFNPMQQLKTLSIELQNMKFRGSVVFDLLYTNGQAYNRFVEINFDGTAFDRKSLNIIEHIDYNLKSEQDDFFRSAPDILAGTVLSEAERAAFISSH
jgi:hypothetical protein